MYITKFFYVLPFTEDVEIVVARLPKSSLQGSEKGEADESIIGGV